MEPKYKSIWSALRAGIQMGGACVIDWKQNKITPRRWHAFLVWEDRIQMLSLIEGIEAPRSGIAERRRRLMTKGQIDGYHWKDRR